MKKAFDVSRINKSSLNGDVIIILLIPVPSSLNYTYMTTERLYFNFIQDES